MDPSSALFNKDNILVHVGAENTGIHETQSYRGQFALNSSYLPSPGVSYMNEVNMHWVSEIRDGPNFLYQALRDFLYGKK
jgi:hypothetical protein